ncbi:MAG: hypothetical protein ABII18_08040 [bacterium]|nr:hypothetical protein [bacterium]MBU1916570.1 hypothetical protein [bacterium]
MARKIIAYFLFLVSIALTIPVIDILFHNNFVTLKDALYYHAVSSLVCITGFFFLTYEHAYRKKNHNLWLVYATTICLTMPVFGIYSSIIIYMAQALSDSRPPPIVEDVINVPDAKVYEQILNRSRQIEVMDRADIAPFVDIFKSSETSLKKSAVKLLGGIESRKAINGLMLALMDKEIEIRLLAAGILGKIEDDFARQIKTLTLKVEQDPHDQKLGEELVNVFLAYATSNLLDKVSASYYYEEIIKIIDNIQETSDLTFIRAKTYFSLKKFEKAEECINRCIQNNDKVPQYHELQWALLLEERKYTELKELIALAEQKGLKGLNKNIMKYWLN